MKLVAAKYLAIAVATGISTSVNSQDLAGAWTLSIRDLNHKEVSILTVRFSGDRGRSSIGGDWKQIVVEAAKTSDKDFFPVTDALTYEIKDAELVIGRNGVCDGYLRLRGKFDGERVQGSYYSFGLGGEKDLGEFSLSRSR